MCPNVLYVNMRLFDKNSQNYGKRIMRIAYVKSKHVFIILAKETSRPIKETLANSLTRSKSFFIRIKIASKHMLTWTQDATETLMLQCKP